MNRLLPCLALGALPAVATATDLDISVESGGLNSITVSPGQVVSYDVVGELTDSLNEGLALFSVDLDMPGATLTPAATPTAGNMVGFAPPLGLSNPAGFGGTQSGSSLKQVGGMQNTIKNSFAPQPSGSVATGIAQPGAAEVLASGTVTAPTQHGTYTLSASNVLANVIRQGESGAPTWFVDAAGLGSNTGLDVTVESLTQSTSSVSLGAGGSVTFNLDGGLGSAGKVYFLLASATGTSPGIPVDGLTLDLALDAFVTYTLTKPNQAPYANTLGAFDPFGMASASVNVPAGSFPTLAGASIHHAYLVLGGGAVDLTSNPVTLNLLP